MIIAIVADHAVITGATLDRIVAGNNFLDGGIGNDTLIASGASDVLRGGAGNDTYVIGSGAVSIEDTSGNNTLVMANVTNAAGLTLASVTNGGGTTLGIVGGGGVVIGANNGAIDAIRFADGSSIAYSTFLELHQDQVLAGDDNDGYVKSGRDTNDTIRGKKGNDLLVDGNGNDTYFFDAGDGKDVLSADADGNVTLKFGAGIIAIQINSQNGCVVVDDIILQYGDNGDSILIKRGKKGVINKIEFADGTVMTATEIAKQFGIDNAYLKTTESSDLIHGTAEDDRVVSGGGNDVLFGGAGEDWLNGENGDDTLHGGVGNDNLRGENGDDYITGGAGNDVIDSGYDSDTIFFA